MPRIPIFSQRFHAAARFRPWHSHIFSQLRWGDGLILILLGGLAIYAWQLSRSSEGSRLLVEIKQREQRSFYPLDQDRNLVLKNRAGRPVMSVKIQDDKVWVQEASCFLKYCVQRGAIDSAGQWIACLPNQVFIRVLAAHTDSDESDTAPFHWDAEVF